MSSAHFSVATAIEKDKIASDIAFILLLEIDVVDLEGNPVETIRLAKNSEDLTYRGHTYAASNFTAKVTLDKDTDPRFDVSADDPTGVIRDKMTLYGGGIGCVVRFMVVNSGNLTQPPEVFEVFKVIQASHAGYQVSFTMGVDNPLSSRFPNRLQYKSQCTYQYKGTRCKYAGPLANCDYTYFGANGCKAHDNEENYGGFLGLNNYSA